MKINFALLIALLSSHTVLADNIKSPRGDSSILYTCNDNNCSAWAVDNDSKVLIFKNVPTNTISAKWLSADLAQVGFSCGSPCSVSFFYSKKHGVSQPRQDVIAVDTKGLCLLSPSQDGIFVSNIFDDSKKIWSVKYNDKNFQFYTQSAVIFSTINGKFDSNGNLKISYIDASGKDSTRTIASPCRQ